jgi:hypothetical protein
LNQTVNQSLKKIASDGRSNHVSSSSTKGFPKDLSDCRTRKRLQKINSDLLNGFVNAFKFWLHFTKFNCKSELIKPIFFQDKFINAESAKLVKTFKVTLAYNFSKFLGQELPEKPELGIFDLFSLKVIENHYKRRWLRRTRMIRDLWNLMQIKELTNEVPKDMILETYIKHQKTLTDYAKTPEKVLLEIKRNAAEFAQSVQKNYREEIDLAPSKAYFSSKRSEGGCYKALRDKIISDVKRVNYSMINEFNTRIDPPCLYLYGRTGVRKSYLTNLITKSISERFGLENSVYHRNFEQDHWDGYSNQLICQFDDAFQQRDSVSKADELVGQMIVLKSNCIYQPPMAKLEEKGRKFSSEFLVLSSNIEPQHLCLNMTESIRCKNALLRRFNFPIEILEVSTDKIRCIFRRIEVKNPGDYESEISESSDYFEGSIKVFIMKVKNLMMSAYYQSVKNALDSKEVSQDHRLRNYSDWLIPVVKTKEGNSINLAYSFPKILPKENICEAYAIPQKLKVRLITKSQPISWALKPLQKAMWRALQEFPCFALTGGKSIEDFIDIIDYKNLIINNKDKLKRFFVSGDYTSATDQLNSDIMETISNEIIKVFGDNKTLQNYIKWECSQHRVTYPKWTNLEDIIQTRGQLMGSLMSFPILCIANVSTITLSKKLNSISDAKALINGDDILFCATEREIKSWKRIATSMGLEPSIGKNYISKEFCSINSQLLELKNKSLKLERTGKFKVLFDPKSSDQIQLSKSFGFDENDIKHFGLNQLKKTPQNLSVPKTFGGLSSDWDFISPFKEDKLSREVYSFIFREKSKFETYRLPDNKIGIFGPKFLCQKFKFIGRTNSKILNDYRTFFKCQSDSLIDEEFIEDNTFKWNKFNKHLQEIKKNQFWREFVRNGSLISSIPLNLMKKDFIIINNEDDGILKQFNDLFWNPQIYLKIKNKNLSFSNNKEVKLIENHMNSKRKSLDRSRIPKRNQFADFI